MRIYLVGLSILLSAGCNNVMPVSDLRTQNNEQEELSPDNFILSQEHEIPDSDDNKLQIERAPRCDKPVANDPKIDISVGAETVTEIGLWVVEDGADFSSAIYIPVGVLDNDGKSLATDAFAYGTMDEEAALRLGFFSKLKKSVGAIIKKTLKNVEEAVKHTFRQPGKVIRKVFAGVLQCAKQEFLDKLIPSRDLVASFLGKSLFEKFLGADVTKFLVDSPLAAQFDFNGKAITLSIGKAGNGTIKLNDTTLGKIAKDLLNSEDWPSFAAKNALGKSNADAVMAIKAALQTGTCKNVAEVIKATDQTGTWDAAMKNDILNTNIVCSLLQSGKDGLKFEDLITMAEKNFKKYQKELINRLIRSQLYAGLNAVVPQAWVAGFASCLVEKLFITSSGQITQIASSVPGISFEAPLNTALIPMIGTIAGLTQDGESSGAAVLTADGYDNLGDIDSLFGENTIIKEPMANIACDAQ